MNKTRIFLKCGWDNFLGPVNSVHRLGFGRQCALPAKASGDRQGIEKEPSRFSAAL